MMNCKDDHDGFSLIEVLFAMAIALFVLTPLFITQGMLLKNVARQSHSIERIFVAKRVFVDLITGIDKESKNKDINKEKEQSFEKKVTDPPTTLFYTVKSPSEQSTLASYKDIHIHRLAIEWTTQGKKEHLNLVSFSFYSPPQEKKASQAKQPKTGAVT